jgi:HK97 family phage major capsid protein
MQAGSGADGGYVIPVTTDNGIIPLASVDSTMRQLATVVVTTNDVKYPRQDSNSVAEEKDEATTTSGGGSADFSETSPTLDFCQLGAYMYGAIIPVTYELAQDAPQLDGFLRNDLARAVNVKEEAKFINGIGSTTEPEGVVTGAETGLTGAWSVDNLDALTAELKQAYIPNATYLMNRKTGLLIRQEQRNDNQFAPYFTSVGRQDFLFGFPIAYSSEMIAPTAGSFSPGDVPVIFGDFRAGVKIGDRGGNAIVLKVLDQVYAKSGLIGLQGYRRADQRVVCPEALKTLVIGS